MFSMEIARKKVCFLFCFLRISGCVCESSNESFKYQKKKNNYAIWINMKLCFLYVQTGANRAHRQVVELVKAASIITTTCHHHRHHHRANSKQHPIGETDNKRRRRVTKRKQLE